MDKYFNKKDVVNGYSIIKILGEGRYGIAYLAINDKNEKCVVKQLKNEMLEKTRKKLFYEEKIMKSLDSPYFPKFISKFKDKYREGYLIEYIEGQSFYSLLQKKKYKLSKKAIYKVCEQLLDIIEVLHSYNIAHRDIRLPNVMVRENNDLALIDFGLARFVDGKKYSFNEDFWYIGDLLVHLHYLSYDGESNDDEKPWYDELDLTLLEKTFIKKLMGIDNSFSNINEIRDELSNLDVLA